MNRAKSLSSLEQEEFDICIIGAGASGAGCALDAVLRGYKVALIDKNDFAAQTSSKSTKLIHGGVRYLEQAFKKLDFGQLKQVKHGLEERHLVIKNAPHLARPLALLTPVESWIEGLYYSIGLFLYDQFAQNDTLPKSKWLSKKQVLERMPTLNRHKLHSAVLYYDGQLDDARYCLALAKSASENGAVVANYIEVKSFGKEEDGTINRVNTIDVVSKKEMTVRAKLVINCTGPYSDHIRLLANSTLEERIRPSKGVHLMLPYDTLKSDDAMLIPKTSDGRVVFAIPFEGVTMLGTTDTDAEGLKEPLLNQKEKEYLADTLNPYLEKPIDPEHIKSGFGGLRPLLAASSSKSTKSLVRDHEVEVDEVSGLVSLLGGKWTTYRLMAKDTLDTVDSIFKRENDCKTAEYILSGGKDYDFLNWKKLNSKYQIPEDIAKHLTEKYGTEAEQVVLLAGENQELLQRIHIDYPFIKAEVIYSVRNEMVVRIRDFTARRTRMEIMDWQDTLDSIQTVGELIGSELGWDHEKLAKEVFKYSEKLQHFIRTAGTDQIKKRETLL